MTLTLVAGAEVRPLTPARVQAGLPTRLLGRAIEHHQRVDSTNLLARERARSGAPEGLLVLAEEQVAGRGRRDRRWEAPLGSSILASLLLRPTFLPARQAFLLTALAALAVDRAIRRETGLCPTLKWPNDLLIQERKVCGILLDVEGRPAAGDAQRSADGIGAGPMDPDVPTTGDVAWVVVGWGLNVNVDFSAHNELAGRATSLALELGRPLSRLPLLWACLWEMEALYEDLREGRGEEIWAAWRDRLSILGRMVQVAAPEGTISGQVVDLGRDGALRVRRADGTEVRVLAGDLAWAPPS